MTSIKQGALDAHGPLFGPILAAVLAVRWAAAADGGSGTSTVTVACGTGRSCRRS